MLTLEGECTIAVGRLGDFVFPRGYYLYIGSALVGLSQRIGRHLRRDKRLRWHIDYLLREAEVAEVWYLVGGERSECAWCRAAMDMPGARLPVRGFGASDCRCPSHLVYFPAPPSFVDFRERAGEGLERLIPGIISDY